MKVICCIESYLPGLSGGGPVRALSNLIGVSADAVEFRIITRNRDYLQTKPYSGITPNTWIRQSGVEVFYGEDKQWECELVKEMSVFRPDWLYLHGALAPMARRVLLLRQQKEFPAGVRILLAPHGNFGPASMRHHWIRKKLWLYYASMKRLYRGVFWHAASGREAEQIRFFLGAEARIRTVPMAPQVDDRALHCSDELEQTDFYPAPASFDRRSIHFVYFGRLSHEKGLPFAIRTLIQLSKKKPELNFYYDIIGSTDDAYAQKIRRLINDLPANLSISLKGEYSREQLLEVLDPEFFKKSNQVLYNGLLMPTLTENFSYTVFESFQAGLPVVISDQTPWRNLPEKGLGWDLSLNCPEGWLSALTELSEQTYDARLEAMKTSKQFARNWVKNYKNTAIALFELE